MRFHKLPLKLRLFFLAQALAAVGVAALAWTAPDPSDLGILAFLVIFSLIGGVCRVDLEIPGGRLSLGFTVTYFALMLLGLPAALLVGFTGTLAGVAVNIRDRQNLFQPAKAVSVPALFNYANGALATAAMGWVYTALGGGVGPLELSRLALPVLASALTYYFINTGGVTLALAWTRGISFRTVYRENWAWAWPGFLASACISAGLLWWYRNLAVGPGALLLLPPAYLVYYFFRGHIEKARSDAEHHRELNRLNDAVIGSLAMAIDAKDRQTHRHVNRVREYAMALGRRLGVSEDELQAIRIASLLHDIGKIGIPEAILCKPGKLTAEEFEIVKSHVEIGAAILDRVDFPWPVVPVVLSHHERWDGLGYPRGLKGEEIPIGGRILALVDVYDALTSDRPYRREMPREAAIAALRAQSGSHFDPRVVETFIALLPEMDVVIARIQEEDDAGLPAVPQPKPVPPPVRCDEAEDAVVLQELADLGLAGLPISEVAPRLGEGIQRLVPYTSFALYMCGAEGRRLVPVHAGGLWTDLIEGSEIRLGEGASGFVAARGESVMNAAAALDLARRVHPSDTLELNSTLAVPLRLHGAVIGTLTLYHSSYNFYQPFHLERMERVAQFVARILEEGRIRETALPLPALDRVTGLQNAHALAQFVRAEITVARSREAEFTAVLLAIEAVPGPNHRATEADRVDGLRRLTTILQETVRDGDYVARAGANSLAVVLPDCGEWEARSTAKRIMARAAREGLDDAAAGTCLRAGIAAFPRDGATAEALLGTARERLVEGLPTPGEWTPALNEASVAEA